MRRKSETPAGLASDGIIALFLPRDTSFTSLLQACYGGSGVVSLRAGRGLSGSPVRLLDRDAAPAATLQAGRD